MTKAKEKINPEMLKLARERASLGVDYVADSLHIMRESLLNWESGVSQPHPKQLVELGELYNQSFTFFFMDKLPKWMIHYSIKEREEW